MRKNAVGTGGEVISIWKARGRRLRGIVGVAQGGVDLLPGRGRHPLLLWGCHWKPRAPLAGSRPLHPLRWLLQIVYAKISLWKKA